MLGMPKAEAIQKLQSQIKFADSLLKPAAVSGNSFILWRAAVKRALDEVFGPGSRFSFEFESLKLPPATPPFLDNALSGVRREALEKGRRLLENAIQTIKTDYPDPKEVRELESQKPIAFVVHGHNDGIKAIVARYLERLGCEAIILHEQPNKGRTIIQKFLDYSKTTFAVAIFSADDIGASKREPENLKPRARQNVVLEFGFFLGKIGPQKTFALVEKGVELPSDYDGVIYIPYDPDEGWQLKLVQELQGAGVRVDANKLTARNSAE